jgi:hypothetical protein
MMAQSEIPEGFDPNQIAVAKLSLLVWGLDGLHGMKFFTFSANASDPGVNCTFIGVKFPI